jgi:hypothetical protein
VICPLDDVVDGEVGDVSRDLTEDWIALLIAALLLFWQSKRVGHNAPKSVHSVQAKTLRGK